MSESGAIPSSKLPPFQASTLPPFHPSAPPQSLPPLPFRRTFLIAVRGIRIRLGRSLVTLSGVALGIAFLVSALITQLIDRAVATEREQRRTVELMENVLRSELGSPEGKTIAIVASGALSPAEQDFLTALLKSRPAVIRGLGFNAPGVTPAETATLGASASALLVLGASPHCPYPPRALMAGMLDPVILDSRDDRTFAEPLPPAARRVTFFSAAPERAERLGQQARQERFRLLWILLIALAVTVTGVANALLMSVTERFREIGTIKCLGGLSHFIRTLFLIESALIGLAGSAIGALAGAGFTLLIYGFSYSFSAVFGSLAYGWLFLILAAATLAGTVLSMIAALYPAYTAARMVPAAALRSTV